MRWFSGVIAVVVAVMFISVRLSVGSAVVDVSPPVDKSTLLGRSRVVQASSALRRQLMRDEDFQFLDDGAEVYENVQDMLTQIPLLQEMLSRAATSVEGDEKAAIVALHIRFLLGDLDAESYCVFLNTLGIETDYEAKEKLEDKLITELNTYHQATPKVNFGDSPDNLQPLLVRPANYKEVVSFLRRIRYDINVLMQKISGMAWVVSDMARMLTSLSWKIGQMHAETAALFTAFYGNDKPTLEMKSAVTEFHKLYNRMRDGILAANTEGRKKIAEMQEKDRKRREKARTGVDLSSSTDIFWLPCPPDLFPVDTYDKDDKDDKDKKADKDRAADVFVLDNDDAKEQASSLSMFIFHLGIGSVLENYMNMFLEQQTFKFIEVFEYSRILIDKVIELNAKNIVVPLSLLRYGPEGQKYDVYEKSHQISTRRSYRYIQERLIKEFGAHELADIVRVPKETPVVAEVDDEQPTPVDNDAADNGTNPAHPAQVANGGNVVGDDTQAANGANAVDPAAVGKDPIPAAVDNNAIPAAVDNDANAAAVDNNAIPAAVADGANAAAVAAVGEDANAGEDANNVGCVASVGQFLADTARSVSNWCCGPVVYVQGRGRGQPIQFIVRPKDQENIPDLPQEEEEDSSGAPQEGGGNRLSAYGGRRTILGRTQDLIRKTEPDKSQSWIMSHVQAQVEKMVDLYIAGVDDIIDSDEAFATEGSEDVPAVPAWITSADSLMKWLDELLWLSIAPASRRPKLVEMSQVGKWKPIPYEGTQEWILKFLPELWNFMCDTVSEGKKLEVENSRTCRLFFDMLEHTLQDQQTTSKDDPKVVFRDDEMPTTRFSAEQFGMLVEATRGKRSRGSVNLMQRLSTQQLLSGLNISDDASSKLPPKVLSRIISTVLVELMTKLFGLAFMELADFLDKLEQDPELFDKPKAFFTVEMRNETNKVFFDATPIPLCLRKRTTSMENRWHHQRSAGNFGIWHEEQRATIARCLLKMRDYNNKVWSLTYKHGRFLKPNIPHYSMTYLTHPGHLDDVDIDDPEGIISDTTLQTMLPWKRVLAYSYASYLVNSNFEDQVLQMRVPVGEHDELRALVALISDARKRFKELSQSKDSVERFASFLYPHYKTELDTHKSEEKSVKKCEETRKSLRATKRELEAEVVEFAELVNNDCVKRLVKQARNLEPFMHFCTNTEQGAPEQGATVDSLQASEDAAAAIYLTTLMANKWRRALNRKVFAATKQKMTGPVTQLIEWQKGALQPYWDREFAIDTKDSEADAWIQEREDCVVQFAILEPMIIAKIKGIKAKVLELAQRAITDEPAMMLVLLQVLILESRFAHVDPSLDDDQGYGASAANASMPASASYSCGDEMSDQSLMKLLEIGDTTLNCLILGPRVNTESVALPVSEASEHFEVLSQSQGSGNTSAPCPQPDDPKVVDTRRTTYEMNGSSCLDTFDIDRITGVESSKANQVKPVAQQVKPVACGLLKLSTEDMQLSHFNNIAKASESGALSVGISSHNSPRLGTGIPALPRRNSNSLQEDPETEKLLDTYETTLDSRSTHDLVTHPKTLNPKTLKTLKP
eukprot:GHVQ01034141.1.p1 GENE.GHVQ01034141.1~~GHVQ01034141.1.p1  ORF type:complete len:1565 (+),score=199.20 GHVQ01034141.1:150-4844(+)